jgi:hypothetical protein
MKMASQRWLKFEEKKEGREKIKNKRLNKIEEKLVKSGRITGAHSYERKRKI